MVELLNAAYALHPAFAEAEIVEIGATRGRPFPTTCRASGGRAHGAVNGLYRHGFLLAPAMARIAAAAHAAGREPCSPEVMDEDHGQR